MATKRDLPRSTRGMQLRRGPPPTQLPVAKVPQLRLIEAPVAPVRSRSGRRSWRPLESYTLRVVAGVMLASIPLSIVLGFVMATWSAQTSIDQAKARAEATAASASVRIFDWVGERQAELGTLAHDQVGDLSSPDLYPRLVASAASHPAFDAIQFFDASGKLVASSVPDVQLSPTASGGTFNNSLTVETIGPVTIAGGNVQWVMTAPMF